jgi:hypothetical protein
MKNSEKIWPFAIGGAITIVFIFGVATVIATSSADIQKSDTYMTYYQDADARANEFIQARINFDKKYKVDYINNTLDTKDSLVSYKITTVDGKAISNAKILLSISRPETHKFDKSLDNFTQKDGIYTFHNVDFEKAGKWNLIAKITVGDDYRFLNIKADTRDKKYKQF